MKKDALVDKSIIYISCFACMYMVYNFNELIIKHNNKEDESIEQHSTLKTKKDN
jgi:hypothetical protein